MTKKILLFSGGTILLTLFSVVSYMSFNIFGITQSRVKRNELTIVTASADKVFDGNPLSNDSWYIESGQLEVTDRLEVVLSSSIVFPGTVQNEIGITIFDEDSKIVTENYKITLKLGALTVHKRDLYIQTASDEKVYDGTPLSKQQWQITNGTLLSNHRIEHIMSSSITNPGQTNNDIGITIYDDQNRIVTNGYNIVLDIGVLVVRGIDLVIQTENLGKIYDGQPLISTGWDLIQGQLASNHRIEYYMNSRITTPGAISNEINITIFDQNNQIVTDKYSLDFVLGQLTVLPRPITVQTETLYKNYDGTPLTSQGWVISSGILIEEHRLIGTMNSSITEPGSILNEIGVTILDSQDQIVTNYYQIDTLLGSLNVNPIPILITTESKDKIYDGIPLESTGWMLQNGQLLEGHHIEASMVSSITNPGSIENQISVFILNETGINVTSMYIIGFQIGFLTVYHRPLTISTESIEKIYDGTPITSDVWRLDSGLLLDGHRFQNVMNASITNPGSILNTIGITILDSQNQPVTDRYEINLNLGLLTVESRPLTIQTETISKIFDGQPLLSDVWDIVAGQLIGQHRIETIMLSSITYPGTVLNRVTPTIYNESNVDVTSFYEIELQLGSLTVQTRRITVETEGATKVYDGTPLNHTVWNIISGDVPADHRVEFVMNTSITLPGTIPNIIGITIYNLQNEDITSGYTITYNLGTLVVQKRNITIQTETITKFYDGTPLTSNTWSIFSGILVDGHTILPHMNSTITEPGNTPNIINITVFDGMNTDVSSGYNITYILGELVIKPIPITLRSLSDVKVYDGTPLTKNEWTLIQGEMLENHQLFVIIDGEITDVGSVKNLIFAYALDNTGKNVSHFYEFIYFEGELTILTSLYGGGGLATSPFETPDIEVMKVFSSKNETIYLRDRSWGGYYKRGWYNGLPYNTTLSVNPLSFTSIVLQEVGRMSNLIQVEYLREQIPYLVPYFSTDTITGNNDVMVYGDTTGIMSHQMIGYTFKPLDGYQIQNPTLSSQEILYRSYVYSQYLSLPESTLQDMLEIIESVDLDPNSPNIILEVKEYIRNAAVYNKQHDPYPDNVDMAIYFLNVLKEGICQHYATAGVVMYRALGIPARYVTGYMVHAKANTWTTVKAKQAHAWVEVYIDGMGWIPMEVTGAGFDDGFGGGSGGSGGLGDGDESLPKITVTPRNVRELYTPGKIISPTQVIFTGFSTYLSQGYTYQVTLSGELAEPGLGVSKIVNIALFDPEGADVTDQFNIEYKDGILQLYQYEIDIYTGSSQKDYDGTPLIKENYYFDGSLAVGHTIQSIQFTGQQTFVGSSKNRVSIIIIDDNGNNVTGQYLITPYYGDLVVLPRTIVIESGTTTKMFDGTPLENHTYTITSGELASTDTIYIEFSGSQTSVGMSENTIESIRVMNGSTDVTRNYQIEIVEGELIVRPRK